MLGLAIIVCLRCLVLLDESNFCTLFMFLYGIFLGTHAATDIMANKNKKEEPKPIVVPPVETKPEDAPKPEKDGSAE